MSDDGRGPSSDGHRLEVRHLPCDFAPDPDRVLAIRHWPGEESHTTGQPRLARLLQRILDIPDEEVSHHLAKVRTLFSHRHRQLESLLRKEADAVATLVGERALTEERRLLLGAYLLREYSVEGASLSNPSMVAAPDQSGTGPGERRVILSLRAIGEGHLSSVEFRSGVLSDDDIVIDPPSPYATCGTRSSPIYRKEAFASKLAELDADPEQVAMVLEMLDNNFSLAELELARAVLDEEVTRAKGYQTSMMMHWLAHSNYVTRFPPETDLSERVLFPEARWESRGIEDARFVQIDEDDAGIVYYATYTAYDGFQILPQLLNTNDFLTFRAATMTGAGAQNKGMALFPRRLGGRWVALSRIGGEDISIMSSDSVRHWPEASTLKRPERPWELFQMGNCGSPLETEAGWLVLTHGVGPLRRYCLGALLLDKDEPDRVLASTPEPILEPAEDRREGYVPNVVYSCGGMLHRGQVVLPYGVSDVGARIAVLDLDALLGVLHTPAARR